MKAKGKERKPERKELDNVSKKTIREEIEKYKKEKGKGSKSEDIFPVNTSPTNPKEKIKSKAPQTERSLSNLLEKIRSKSCTRGNAKSSVKKMKKLQVTYIKTYKLVRQKDGGGSRFIDLYTEDTILFKNIRAKVENENCNYFVGELHECVTLINDITGKQLDENEFLWDYLKKKKTCKNYLKRTFVQLKYRMKVFFDDMGDLSNLNT